MVPLPVLARSCVSRLRGAAAALPGRDPRMLDGWMLAPARNAKISQFTKNSYVQIYEEAQGIEFDAQRPKSTVRSRALQFEVKTLRPEAGLATPSK